MNFAIYLLEDMVYIHRKEGGGIYGKQNDVCSNHQRHGLSKSDIVINKITDE